MAEYLAAEFITEEINWERMLMTDEINWERMFITEESIWERMLMTDESIWEMVLMVFGAGLATGGMIFLLSLGASHALKIFKSI